MPRQARGARGGRPPRGESSGWEDVDDDWGPTRPSSQRGGRGRGRTSGRQASFLLPHGGVSITDGVRRYQEILREERQKRRWQQAQPRLSAITASGGREDPEESSDEEGQGGGQQIVAKELTIGGCSGNAGRPPGSAPHDITPSVSSSASPMLALEGRRESGRETVSPILMQDGRRESGRETVLPVLAQDGRRESGQEAVEVRQGKEAETAWWEGSETKGIPVFWVVLRGLRRRGVGGCVHGGRSGEANDGSSISGGSSESAETPLGGSR